MNLSHIVRPGCWMLAVVVIAAGTARAAEVPSKSEAAAATLTKLLDEQKLDSFAARDPSNPEYIVAALYSPGRHLLVIGARYLAPHLMDQRFADRNYQEIYMELHVSCEQATKVFVEDFGADGLHAVPVAKVFDIVESPEVKTTFDGNWQKSGVSEAGYMKAFAAADETYARLLHLLTSALTARKTS